MNRPTARRVLAAVAACAAAGALAGSVSGPLAASAGAAAPAASAQRRPPPLLPDMTPLRASDLSVEKSAGVRRLRFEAGLANIGVGPMEVRPNQARQCRAGKRHASQVVYRDRDHNGHFRRDVDRGFTRRSAGCMVFHPQHDHWHFEAASRYRLFRPGAEGTLLVRARKMSFCLRDSARVPARFGTFHKPLYYRECGRDTPQGISTGWVDVYASYLAGQALTLPRRLGNGVYCLGIRVDPRDELWESDEANNDSVRAFRLHGTRVRPVPRNDVCAPPD